MDRTTTNFPRDKCLHHLFEEQAAATPEAVAVACEGQILTCRELDQQANRLGRYLLHLGVRAETQVALCLERSLGMSVAVLGILKAPGCCLPLDPNCPKMRLAFMLEDTQTPVLLTQAQLRDRLPETKARVVCLDSDWHRTEMERNITDIWKRVMKLERIGPYDNFFDLGGHSLMAVRIAARIRACLGVELPVCSIFEKPTVAELAAHVDSLSWTGQPQRSPSEEAEAALSAGNPMELCELLLRLERMQESSSDVGSV